ncbi:MAG: sulfotransferase [Pirellulaceae bacterium]|jgi:hypothetical protein|nr:sulfotransferase [Pirellulaceae bacterium]
MVKSPVFQVGCERSGTTLLRLMLDHHPRISFLFEFEYAVDQIRDPERWPSMDAYRRWLESNRNFIESRFTIDPQLDYPHLVDDFLRQKQARDGKPVVGATVHYEFDKLTRIWPDARFIHIMRDGRDVARSVVQMGWAGNVWDGTGRWITAEKMWQQMRCHLPADRWIELKYEDLVADADGSMQRICRFIGVPMDKAVFDYAKTSTYDLPDPTLISRWKQHTSDYQVQLVESRIGDMLRERGYELSGLPRMKISACREFWLQLQSRLGRAHFRLRRYGWALFLRDLLARRMFVRTWQSQIQREIRRIDALHIK